MKQQIIKIRNMKGQYFTCSKCGHEIKHAYTLEGGKEIFGSECIKHVAGYSNQIKEQNKRMGNVEEMLNPSGLYGNSFFKGMESRGFSESEMIYFYLKGGKL